MSTRLSLTMDEPLERDDAHEHLTLLFNNLVAHEIEESLQGLGLEPTKIRAIRDTLVFDLAMLSDQGEIVVNGKVYRPRVALVGDDDNLLPGATEFDYMHEYAIIDDDDLASLAFEPVHGAED